MHQVNWDKYPEFLYICLAVSRWWDLVSAVYFYFFSSVTPTGICTKPLLISSWAKCTQERFCVVRGQMRCVGTLPLLPPCLPMSNLNTLAFSDLCIWAFFLLNTSIKLLFFHRKNNVLMVQENTGSIQGNYLGTWILLGSEQAPLWGLSIYCRHCLQKL